VTRIASDSKAAGRYENGISRTNWDSKEGLRQQISNIRPEDSNMGYRHVIVSQSVAYGTVRRVDDKENLLEERNSVERVWE